MKVIIPDSYDPWTMFHPAMPSELDESCGGRDQSGRGGAGIPESRGGRWLGQGSGMGAADGAGTKRGFGGGGGYGVCKVSLRGAK